MAHPTAYLVPDSLANFLSNFLTFSPNIKSPLLTVFKIELFILGLYGKSFYGQLVILEGNQINLDLVFVES